MKYMTKQCQICGKQFVVRREVAHKVKCCTLGCLDRMESGVTAVWDGVGPNAQELSE